jgi:hypothetical protein
MIPVLIDSRKPGASSWTIVHESVRQLQVSGMKLGDRVKLILWLKQSEPKEQMIELTGPNEISYAIAHENLFAVRADHSEASGAPVNVSLIR